MGPLTGDNAVYGMAVNNAAQMAVDEINAAGGVNGYTLELNFQDDESDAEKAVNAYNVLKDWGAQMIVGAVTSGPFYCGNGKDNGRQYVPADAFRLCCRMYTV